MVLGCLLTVGPTSASTPGGATGLSRLKGIDACAAPSLDTMRAFYGAGSLDDTPYGDLGIYLGGVNRACKIQPNLTASWVSQAVDIGWSFMPIWVGPQAPCINRTGLALFSNDPVTAAAQGKQEASGAIAAAQGVGFSKGGIVYYDMEAYGTTCSPAVRAFVGGWVSALHAAGWKAGTYGSCVSVGDFAAASPPPDALWFAHWDGVAGPTDPTCPATQAWSNDRLIKQWQGGHNETWNAVTLNVDSNCADGIVAPIAHGLLPFCSNTPNKTPQMDRRLDAFVRGTNNLVYHRWFAFGAWSTGWENLGGPLTSGPTAVSWGSGRIDLFGRGSSKQLLHRSYSAGRWSAWENLGGVLTSAPDVAAWGSGRLDVFARGGSNQLVHRTFANGRWSSTWEHLGGSLTSGPTAVSWGSGRIDVFGRNTSNRLIHRWFSGGRWSGSWENLGGALSSGPDAASWGSGRLDVFVRGPNNLVYHRWFANGAWSSGWENLGGPLASGPTAVSWGSGRIDVFGRNTSNRLIHRWFSGGRWSGSWENLGGTFADDPDASGWST